MLSLSPVASDHGVPPADRRHRVADRWLTAFVGLVLLLTGATASAQSLAAQSLAAQSLAAQSLAAQSLAAPALDDRAAAWAADDAQIVARAAPRLIASALAPTFEAMDRRVVAYADWVYGWFSSLLTAWDLAAIGAIEIQQEVSAGQVPDPAILYGRLADMVQERFDETVAHPEATENQIAQAWSRSMLRVAALDATLAAERGERIRLLADRLGVDPAPALGRYGVPLLTAEISDQEVRSTAVRRALSGVEDGAGGTTDRVLIRSLRPLMTRAISVTTRLLLAPAIGGIVASPVAGTTGLAAAAATLVSISAGIWGVDYAANRLDSALTRSEFETTLRVLVQDAHARTSGILRDQATATVCAAMTDPTPCAALQPVAAPRSDG